MSWLAPQWLWLLAAAPLAALLVLHAHAQRRRAAARFVGEIVGKRLLPSLERGRALGRAALLACGFGLAALAAAGPSWGTREEVITTQGVDVVIALDVSRSMLSENEALTPLARAKASLERLVRENPGDRLGLVLFAGGAAQSCVLTSDTGFFLDALRSAEPSDAGRGGTRIGTALFAAHRVLEPRWFAVHRKLFELVSDAALVRANRAKLCTLLGVPESADLEVELVRLFDPVWLEKHEQQLAQVFGESWSASDLDDDAELRFEAEGDAANDPRRGGKIVLLVTDGIDQDSLPKLAARVLAKRGVRLVTVGVGREGGGERPLVIGGQPQRTRDGQAIALEFASEPLRELARLGNGFYVGTDELLQLVERYRAEFPDLEETRGRRMTLRRGIERYPFFLAPALLCLALYFATPAVRRAASRAASLLLCGALALPLAGCGDELSQRTAEALRAIESGEAGRAEEILRGLQEARPEDPRLAYDRALALQASGDRAGAEREYRKARTGSRPLAARAAFNQGALALETLRSQLRGSEGERAPEELPAAERAAFEEGLARAQLFFEEARRLDPELEEAPRAERDLVRMRSALRDAWQRADAAARRAELEQTQGVAIVEKLEAWLKEIRALAPLDALAAALREREIIDALPLLGERLAAEEALPQTAREALGARANELAIPLGEAADALEQLELSRAEVAHGEVERELAALWSAWAAVDAALKRLIAEGKALASLEATAQVEASAALAERAVTLREREAALEKPLLGQAATAWLREALPRAEEALRERARAADSGAAGNALQLTSERFADLGALIELDALEALPLLERLAREQERSVDGLARRDAPSRAAQVRSERSVALAREKITALPPPAEGASAEELAARERAKEALLAELDGAERAMRAALEAGDGSAEQRSAAREAAGHLREAWSRLAAFDALLGHAIESAKQLLSVLEQPSAADASRDAGAAIARLRARLPLEIERLEGIAKAPSATGAEDPDEAEEIAKILRAADPQLGKARDGLLQSTEALNAGKAADARKPTEEAIARLERLQADLEEARKSLRERVDLLLQREAKARSTLHDALVQTEEGPREEALKALRTEHVELEAETARLQRSLQRELAQRQRIAEQQARQRELAPADPSPPVAPPAPDDSAELRTEVASAIAALDLLRTTLPTDDAEVTLRAIAEAHAALRAPWNRLSDFEALVRSAIDEQKAMIERTQARPEIERAKRFARELQSEVRAQLEPILQKAPPAPAADPNAPAPASGEEAKDPGSIARRNVPLAREAMQSAEPALLGEDPLAALPFEEEARRLLEEILQSDEQQDQQQQQQQPQDQQEQDQEQQSGESPSPQAQDAPLSREEIERLLRTARERKPREPSAEQRQRSAVEEDH
ncbi:MAG: VWA domain-containing protein [Planctomycetes bacterium]|nr:VWA domain-containing protein [Planctomycetota bacterium]